ncbi:MAG TPA: WbqC family protein [Saprospiraceae bacterium]|nr:WbqC family protein [Saprospiraceae bacterium]
MLTFHTAYFPALSWFAPFWAQQEASLEACEHYQKGSIRNRCNIAGPNGAQMLSVPLVKGKHQRTPIRDVRIAYDLPWQRQHWRSICTAYGNAPFFEHFADHLRPFFERQPSFLFDLILEVLQFFLEKTRWSGTLRLTERYTLRGQKGDTPPPHPTLPYPQVFQEKTGFLPDLSVLDLLLCCGRSGSVLLLSQQPQPHAHEGC